MDVKLPGALADLAKVIKSVGDDEYKLKVVDPGRAEVWTRSDVGPDWHIETDAEGNIILILRDEEQDQGYTRKTASPSDRLGRLMDDLSSRERGRKFEVETRQAQDAYGRPSILLYVVEVKVKIGDVRHNPKRKGIITIFVLGQDGILQAL